MSERMVDGKVRSERRINSAFMSLRFLVRMDMDIGVMVPFLMQEFYGGNNCH
jgi:hypothetical protein